MTTVLILILLTIWLILCAFCFGAGYRMALFRKKRDRPTEPDESKLRNARRAEKEYRNMLTYDGSEQEEIE